MTPSELNRAIHERRFPALLLLYGEERFFLEETLHALQQSIVSSESRDFNFTQYYGKTARGGDIIDTARTLPVFSPLRLVVVRDVQSLATAELDVLLPYLADACPETVLVLTADKIDGRRKFYQHFKKYGELVDFKKFYENQIPGFVRERGRQQGIAFAEEAIALFCRRVGTNLAEIAGELEKLATYLGDRDLVDVSDVREIVSDTRIESVFELTNALGRRSTSEAVRVLNRLLIDATPPLVLLTMMTRHFRQMWKAHYLLGQGVEKKDLVKGVGVNPYFLEGLLEQARLFPADRYPWIFERLLELDLALKSSGAHPTALLELLVLQICRNKTSA